MYDHLRAAIINLELPPGEPLARSELMLRFGVSQTPIRDALMSLADEGLVAIYPQNGTSVTLIDTDLALQAHFLRRSVELEVVETLSDRENNVADEDDRLVKKS